MGTLPREKKLASLGGSSIHVFNRGPAGIRSPADGLDPIHSGGVMLVCVKAVTNYRTSGNQSKVKEMAGIRQDIPRCVIRKENQTSTSYVDQSNYS